MGNITGLGLGSHNSVSFGRLTHPCALPGTYLPTAPMSFRSIVWIRDTFGTNPDPRIRTTDIMDPALDPDSAHLPVAFKMLTKSKS